MKNLYWYECHLVESSSPLLSLERNYTSNNESLENDLVKRCLGEK